MKLLFTGCIICHDLSTSIQFVFVADQTFQSHRTPGMKFSCADPHLCTKSITVSVRKTRGTVLIYPGGIHQIHKMLCGLWIFSDDTVCMMRAEAIDMHNGFLHTFHCFCRKNVVQILGPVIHLRSRYTVYYSCNIFCAAQFHLFCIQRRLQHWQQLLPDILVNENCLHGIAGRHILRLGIHNDRNCFRQIRLLIHINMTNAICMSHYRNLGMVHNILHKNIGATRNQQIH